jgi:UTP--glucose-1-phosphate uridylyltransferase
MIKTAIILIAGRGTRFLPMTKVIPKELLPLVDKPILQYIVEEAVNSGVKKIIFVASPDKDDYPSSSQTLAYFKKKKVKKESKNSKELERINSLSKKATFKKVIQEKPLGDGDAVLKAEKLIKGPCAVLFCDDVIESKTPALSQLIKTFKKHKSPVIALKRLPKEKVSSYGVVKVKKEEKKTYRINGIVEKPSKKDAPSNLAVVGKYIITPEVFKFLKKSSSVKGEIRLAGAFEEMIKKKKEIFGKEIEGEWLECGNKIAYLKSIFYLSLKDKRFKKELKSFLKKPRW